MMFTKALFVEALGYLACSLFDEAFRGIDDDETPNPIAWGKLDHLSKVPMNTLDHPIWIKSKVCWLDDTKAKPVVKIHKSSQSTIARVLCDKTSIFPTMSI
jgi:hypothetical protein